MGETVEEQIERQVYFAKEAIRDLVRIRCSKDGDVLSRHEPELLAALASLQFLCSDLRETRLKLAHLEAAE